MYYRFVALLLCGCPLVKIFFAFYGCFIEMPVPKVVFVTLTLAKVKWIAGNEMRVSSCR